MESLLHDSFSFYQRGEDGSYGRRTSEHHQVGPCRLIPHLYGELARHDAGFEYLVENASSVLGEFFDVSSSLLFVSMSLIRLSSTP
jgi:hypothetical protein